MNQDRRPIAGRRPRRCGALGAVLTLGAAVSGGCPSPPRADERAALLAADSAAGADLAEVFADDAYLLVAGLPTLTGREAIAGHLDTAAARVMVRRPLLVTTSADGTHGYSVGRVLVRDAGGGDPGHGKYLAYWRREAGGAWKILAYVANPSPAAPDSVPPAAMARGGAAGSSGSSEQLLAVDAEFSARSEAAGAGDAFAAYADSGAVALLDRGHPMVWGATAIGKYFAEAIPATARLTWTPVAARLAPAGDLGFTTGEATYHDAPGGEPQTFFLKYVTVWRRQPGGEWRYVADGGNPRPPPEGAAEHAAGR